MFTSTTSSSSSSSSSFPSHILPSTTSYPSLADSDCDFWLSLLADFNQHQPTLASSLSHSTPFLHAPSQYATVIPEPKEPDSTTTVGQASSTADEGRTSRTSVASIETIERYVPAIETDLSSVEKSRVSLSLRQEKRSSDLSPTSGPDTDVCNKSGKRPRTSPPRPPNAFILYRKDMSSEFLQSKTGKFVRNGEISKLIGEMWKNESEAVRSSYYSKAAEAKRVHAEKYPAYKYRPARNVVAGGGGGGSEGKHRVVESVGSSGLECDTDLNGARACGGPAPAGTYRIQPTDTVVDQRYRPFSGDSGTIGTSFEQRRQSNFSDTARTNPTRILQKPRRPNDCFPADFDTPEQSSSATAGSEYDPGSFMTHGTRLPNRDVTEAPFYKRMAEVPVGWHAMDRTLTQGNSSTLSDTASAIAARLIQSHPEIQSVLAEAYLAKYLERHRLVPPLHESVNTPFLSTPVPERRDSAHRGPSTMLRTPQFKEPFSTRS